MTRRATGTRRERGSASIEMIGMFPILALAFAALLYVTVAFAGMRSAVTAARDGARTYAVQGDLAAGRAAADRAVPRFFDRRITSPRAHAMHVTVTVPGILGLGRMTFTGKAELP